MASVEDVGGEIEKANQATPVNRTAAEDIGTEIAKLVAEIAKIVPVLLHSAYSIISKAADVIVGNLKRVETQLGALLEDLKRVERLLGVLVEDQKRVAGVTVEDLKRQRPAESLPLGPNQFQKNRTLSRQDLDDVKILVGDAEDVIADTKELIQRDIRELQEIHIKRRENLTMKLENLASNVREVNARIRDLDIASPPFIWRDSDGESGDSDDLHPEKSFMDVENVPLVGIEDATKEIISRLKGEKRFDIVTICGMPGMGKTTLAQKVFSDTRVRRDFDCVAWVCVSYSIPTLVLENLLVSVSSRNLEERALHTDLELTEMLYRSLVGKRYLIVMDDVWGDSWDCVQVAFPKSTGRGRLIITTRSNEVACEITSSIKGSLHQMKGLTDQQSWELFHRTVFRGQSPGAFNVTDPRDDSELAEVAKKILGKCFHVPLAVKVVAGLLASTQTPLWRKMVDQNVVFSQTEDQTPELIREVTSVLTLAYDFLPSHLKRCFLYMGLFPKGAKMKAQKLCHLWFAEGFIVDPVGKGSPMDVAKQYLNELCNRCVVLFDNREVSTGRRIKYYHLHDLMYELCLLKQEEENFCVNKYSRGAPDDAYFKPRE